jgi:hypothetical protein
MKNVILFVLLLLVSWSCKKEDVLCDCGSPVSWVEDLIKKGSDDNGTFSSVYTYQFNDKKVFLLNYEAKCCDFYSSQLFDEKGKSLCYPYGGISGKGDLKCQDFDTGKSAEKLYWKK